MITHSATVFECSLMSHNPKIDIQVLLNDPGLVYSLVLFKAKGEKYKRRSYSNIVRVVLLLFM